MSDAKRGRYRELEHSVVRALDVAPTHQPEPQAVRDASYHYAAGEQARIAGDLVKAVHHFREGVRHEPESPLARAGLIALTAANEMRVARLAEICHAWPELARPRFLLALAQHYVSKVKEARESLEACVRLLPDDKEAWLALAAVHLDLGDEEAAADAVERVLSMAPHGIGVTRSAARLLFRVKRYRRAFAVAFAGARETRHLRAYLLPITLPVLASLRRISVISALIVGAWGAFVYALLWVRGPAQVWILVGSGVIVAWDVVARVYVDRHWRIWRQGRKLGHPFSQAGRTADL